MYNKKQDLKSSAVGGSDSLEGLESQCGYADPDEVFLDLHDDSDTTTT